jgi:sugar lactone lactonase YvrE
MLRIVWTVAALAAAGAVLVGVAPSALAKERFPEVIQLPTGFRPEGIEIGNGTTFYVGSVANGAIYRGDLRTGNGAILVPGVAGRAATGIELDDHNRLFVAGAGTGNAYVYDASTGALIRTYGLGTPPATFINDVVVTNGAAYFTDSRQPVLYRVPIAPNGTLGDAETIPLGGDYEHVDGQFNLNGIDATPNGKALVAVQSFGGKLYRIDPASGDATLISLGGASVPNGDGILLDGKTLFVVQNQLNQVAVIALDPALSAGQIITLITDSDFSVPTTVDEFGSRLYAVNARFGQPNPDLLPYEVVQVRKPTGR